MLGSAGDAARQTAADLLQEAARSTDSPTPSRAPQRSPGGQSATPDATR
jgi:hypothetical protein